MTYRALGPGVCLEVTYSEDLHLVRRAHQTPGLDREADYVLARPYTVEVRVWSPDGANWVQTVTVPAGMRTDLASVPRWARWLVGRVGPHLEASVVHDWLYIAWRHNGGRPAGWKRRWADQVLLAGMEAAGMDWRRWVVYAAVRIGGWQPFSAVRSGTQDFEGET